MPEIEVPTEHLHETIKEAHEHHHHGGGGGEVGPSWVGQVALSAAVLAVAAAIAALLAGHHANEAMLEQMKATDQWAFYQAKGIKMSQLETKLEVLAALGKEGHDEDRKKVEKYKEQQKEIEDKARELEQGSEHSMRHHVVLARAVTAYQVAIALSAVAVLTKKRLVWLAGLALGLLGTVFLVQGLV
jgi:hypothetical protein